MAELFENALHSLLAKRFIAHIARDGQAAASFLLHHALRVLGILAFV